jgi:hypothetical protein
MRMTVLATAAMAAWAGPAGATLICPDETGAYSPMNCDWLMPFEHPPGSHECNFEDEVQWRQTGQGSDPLCVAYWEREAAAEARLKEMLRRLDEARRVRDAELERWIDEIRRQRQLGESM